MSFGRRVGAFGTSFTRGIDLDAIYRAAAEAVVKDDDREVCVCSVSEASKVVPQRVKYRSLRVKNKTFPVKDANDVLLTVCKAMLLYRYSQFRRVISARSNSWLGFNCRGMDHPVKIASNVYVNLDGMGKTPLLRASLVLDWMRWPKEDASISYFDLDETVTPQNSCSDASAKSELQEGANDSIDENPKAIVERSGNTSNGPEQLDGSGVVAERVEENAEQGMCHEGTKNAENVAAVANGADIMKDKVEYRAYATNIGKIYTVMVRRGGVWNNAHISAPCACSPYYQGTLAKARAERDVVAVSEALKIELRPAQLKVAEAARKVIEDEMRACGEEREIGEIAATISSDGYISGADKSAAYATARKILNNVHARQNNVATMVLTVADRETRRNMEGSQSNRQHAQKSAGEAIWEANHHQDICVRENRVEKSICQINDNSGIVQKFSYKNDRVDDVTGSEPISLCFKNREYSLDRRWANLPAKICVALESTWPGKVKEVVANGEVPCMAVTEKGMRRGAYVPEADIWYEKNCSAREFVQQTRWMCRLFGVGLENVSITYTTLGQRPNGQNSKSPSAVAAEDNPNFSKISNPPKIGVYVKQQIYAALAEDRIPDADFDKLLTVEGTKEQLGTTLSACPLFAFSPMIGPDGRGNNSWGDPAVRRGRCVFVNSQWYERHWDKARRLLSRWEKKPLQQAVARANVPSHYCESHIAELLETEFANGIRPGSIIDRNKIRKLYRQHFGEDLPGDFAFDTVLPKVGVVHDGKVFPRPSLKDGDWRDLIERLVGNGSSVFQFSRVMELHAAELMKIGIVSAEMLREVMMREALDTYEISGEVFAPKSEVRLADRFDSVFMPQDGAVIDMTDISKRFPYVDVAFIRNLYKGNPNLIRIDQDRYAILARIDFDDSEVSRGRSYCEIAIASDGFFSLAQLRLDDSAAMNDQRLTDNALRRVFFQRFLSDDFDAHGQIVCAKGASIDGQIPLHAFLNDRSEVSLDQIESVAKEYNIAPWLALKTAHEEMVRIDRDRFIAKGLISFDIAAIDDSIADVCEGYPRPFGAFANLSDFPAVPGFSWNEYLLEAFLRRLSVRFRLVSPSVPARDVSGAVVPRSADLPCAENAFAAIALRCGVAAETEEVGDFLVATQCVLRRSTKTVGAVVSRMKELEKR